MSELIANRKTPEMGFLKFPLYLRLAASHLGTERWQLFEMKWLAAQSDPHGKAWLASPKLLRK
jgi:hypothetical protein